MWSLFLFFAFYISISYQKPSDEDDPEVYHQFETRPDIKSLKWNIKYYDRDALQQGMYWFVGPYHNLKQSEYSQWRGPHIYRDDGELVWSGGPFTEYEDGHDFRMQYLPDGQQGLTWLWQRNQEGNGWILDNTYEPYKIVDTARGEWPNMHEFHLVDGGKHALVMMSPNYTEEVISTKEYSGPCTAGWQGFREVDVETDELLFEWYAEGRIAYSESNYVADDKDGSLEAQCKTRWDITHMNSVDKFKNGDYLLSARFTNALYRISHVDKSIIWRLGGEKSDFDFVDNAGIFSRQHHATIQAENSTHTIISLFDNAAVTPAHTQTTSFESWGMILALRHDVQPMTATLLQRYAKPHLRHTWDTGNWTEKRGSMSILPNGNIFMAWALNCHVSEHAPDGTLLMQAQFPKDGADTYRSYKLPWVGRPAAPPDVVSRVDLEDHVLHTDVYMSWNGATEVATWKILHSDSTGNSSELVATVECRWFETHHELDGYLQYIIAVALDANGEELGRSGVIETSAPKKFDSAFLDAITTEWLKGHKGNSWSLTKPQSWTGTVWIVVGSALGTIALVLGVVFRKRLLSYWPNRVKYQSLANEADSEDFVEIPEYRHEYKDESGSVNSSEAAD